MQSTSLRAALVLVCHLLKTTIGGIIFVFNKSFYVYAFFLGPKHTGSVFRLACLVQSMANIKSNGHGDNNAPGRSAHPIVLWVRFERYYID
jgi:hypothetical protein